MIKISDLKVGSRVILMICTSCKSMRMGAVVKKHIKDNMIAISLEYASNVRLVFDNVKVNAEYNESGSVPVVWSDVKIVYYQSEYIMIAKSDAVRNNRRNAFRVGVSKPVIVHSDKVHGQAMLRDLSESGFSISDRSKNIDLQCGDEIRITLSDMGYDLNLLGKLVRIEKKEDVIIYGFKICNLCKDLSTYVALKQRKVRDEKRRKSLL